MDIHRTTFIPRESTTGRSEPASAGELRTPEPGGRAAHTRTAEGGDGLELTSFTRLLAQLSQQSVALQRDQETATEQRVEALRDEYQRGTLNSPERIRRAAEAILQQP
jgi:hypothetical protein